LGEVLLESHRCYLDDLRQLIATGKVHGLAHITGGGIAGNLSRIIPSGLQAVIDLPKPPPLFTYLAQRGIPSEEMRRVFNMGIGMIAICDPSPPNPPEKGAHSAFRSHVGASPCGCPPGRPQHVAWHNPIPTPVRVGTIQKISTSDIQHPHERRVIFCDGD
jgi:hypothetical protein